jgi:hypothetical protein
MKSYWLCRSACASPRRRAVGTELCRTSTTPTSAGYTYLGQFIDHDITFDPTSTLQRENECPTGPAAPDQVCDAGADGDGKESNEGGPPQWQAPVDHWSYREEARPMLYAGLDLSRKRLDFHLLGEWGETVAAMSAVSAGGFQVAVRCMT